MRRNQCWWCNRSWWWWWTLTKPVSHVRGWWGAESWTLAWLQSLFFQRIFLSSFLSCCVHLPRGLEFSLISWYFSFFLLKEYKDPVASVWTTRWSLSWEKKKLENQSDAPSPFFLTAIIVINADDDDGVPSSLERIMLNHVKRDDHHHQWCNSSCGGWCTRSLHKSYWLTDWRWGFSFFLLNSIIIMAYHILFFLHRLVEGGRA